VGDSAAAARGFHAGEVEVQRRAGVRGAAQRLAGMLDVPDLAGGAARFLAERTFVAVTARDGTGKLWISPLTGSPGFLEVRGHTDLRVHAVPAAGDPLHDVAPGQPVGMLAVEFARRRRVRINGTLVEAGSGGLTVHVDQAYGNCPQYIQQRLLEPVAPVAGPVSAIRRGHLLDPADVTLIRRADTFLLGTSHPDRGADASHRGGLPGFVRVCDDRTLWWPDYPGNNMFNSLGNLAVDPSAALLFVDFATGDTVHLSGTARLDWAASGAGDDGGTGRRVVFTVHDVATGPSLPLRADHVVASPFNPPLQHRV
jgi:predicted pyridoxine 5'-phosphate oxidase superfamily flavin-nucleotide-binding protein